MRGLNIWRAKVAGWIAPAAPPARKRIYSEDPPSDRFLEHFRAGHASLCQAECVCGRVYFVNDLSQSGDFEEGELEELQSLEDGETIIGWDCGIAFGLVDGIDFVIDCRCNYGRRHEEFLWGNRKEITGYFADRSRADLERAEELLSQLPKEMKR